MEQLFLFTLNDEYQRTLTKVGTWLVTSGVRVLILLFIGWFIYRYGAKTLSRIVRRTIRNDLYPTKSDRDKRIKTLDNLINGGVKLGVFLIIGLMIVSELGVNTGPLLASAGILGIAFGFGAQS